LWARVFKFPELNFGQFSGDPGENGKHRVRFRAAVGIFAYGDFPLHAQ
jgi:hypothetical protein